LKREEQIQKAAKEIVQQTFKVVDEYFISHGDEEMYWIKLGAQWADENPRWEFEGADVLTSLDSKIQSLEEKLLKAKEALKEILEFHFYGHHAKKFKQILKELNDPRT